MGGEVGPLGGEASPVLPPLDETLANDTRHFPSPTHKRKEVKWLGYTRLYHHKDLELNESIVRRFK